jgi:hypothetical protein
VLSFRARNRRPSRTSLEEIARRSTVHGTSPQHNGQIVAISSIARMTVFHVSDDPDIEVFEPRTIGATGESLVWAIDDEHLRNYLVPRDCPRVTFHAGPGTTAADRERFLGASRAVVAIETEWLEQVRTCRLFCYHLPSDTFESIDKTAGYFVSRTAVKPVRVTTVEDPLSALLQRGVELRILPSLSLLRAAVIESTLEFSVIRWRNALP